MQSHSLSARAVHVPFVVHLQETRHANCFRVGQEGNEHCQEARHWAFLLLTPKWIRLGILWDCMLKQLWQFTLSANSCFCQQVWLAKYYSLNGKAAAMKPCHCLKITIMQYRSSSRWCCGKCVHFLFVHSTSWSRVQMNWTHAQEKRSNKFNIHSEPEVKHTPIGNPYSPQDNPWRRASHRKALNQFHNLYKCYFEREVVIWGAESSLQNNTE